MKTLLAVAFVSALAAAPAMAQSGFGGFGMPGGPGGFGTHRQHSGGFGPAMGSATGSPDASHRSSSGGMGSPGMGTLPRAPAMPEPKPFKPYAPPKYGSTYAPTPAGPHGARDCELSVYVNACGRGH